MTKMEWYGDDVIRSVKKKLPVAVRKACVIVQDAAQLLSPIKKGALMGSITIEPINEYSAKVGPSIAYDRRIELGFVGADSLGRIYNQAAQPYLRPAADNNRQRVADELGVTIGQAVVAGAKK